MLHLLQKLKLLLTERLILWRLLLLLLLLSSFSLLLLLLQRVQQVQRGRTAAAEGSSLLRRISREKKGQKNQIVDTVYCVVHQQTRSLHRQSSRAPFAAFYHCSTYSCALKAPAVPAAAALAAALRMPLLLLSQ